MRSLDLVNFSCFICTSHFPYAVNSTLLSKRYSSYHGTDSEDWPAVSSDMNLRALMHN